MKQNDRVKYVGPAGNGPIGVGTVMTTRDRWSGEAWIKWDSTPPVKSDKTAWWSFDVLEKVDEQDQVTNQ